MKKFAIVLMMALLVLGCVFAANEDNVILEVNVEKVIPLFEIYGDDLEHKGTVNGSLTDAQIASSTATVVKEELKGDTSSVDLKVLIYEVGFDSSNQRQAYIRYKNTSGVTITVTASDLKNVDYLNASDMTKTEKGSVTNVSDVICHDAYKKDTKDIHTITNSSSSNESVVLSAVYTGEKVTLDNTTTGNEVASWTWTWDTSDLVGGETYRADIYLTYTIE